MEICSVPDCESLVDRLKDDTFHLILADVKRLGTLPRNWKDHAPLVPVAFPGQVEMILQPNQTGTLSKPLKPRILFQAFMEVFNPEQLPVKILKQGPSNEESNSKLKILLAEDNPVNCKVALRILNKLGYRADVVNNGYEVLNTLKKETYHIILLDVQMPEMDGTETARRICDLYPKESRPIMIAMTANALQGDRELCLEAGMDDYLTKPINIKLLRSTLEKFS